MCVSFLIYLLYTQFPKDSIRTSFQKYHWHKVYTRW
jgi:hypothetical protein